MSVVRRAFLIAGLSLVALGASGCTSMWHDMQPYRLHRMNRGPGMPNGTEAYSVLAVGPAAIG